jgi:hypothetical protein
MLLALGACEDRLAHPFGAYRYRPDQDCIEGAAAVDVIDGPDRGPCDAVRCWVSPAKEVYVTTTACDGPLNYAEHTKDAAGSPCARALEAFAREGHSLCKSSE